MSKLDNEICLEEKSKIKLIVKDLVEKNVSENFKNTELTHDVKFLSKFEDEITQSVIRAFKLQGYDDYDEISTAKLTAFADDLIFGRLRYKYSVGVNPNSPKLKQTKNVFRKGLQEEIRETRLGYSSPLSVKTVSSEIFRK